MIEIRNKKLCESCFGEVEEEGKCPHCGFSKEEFEPDPLVLPMGTKLEDKILIGRVMGKGGFGITYLGYDLRMEKAIAVKEYYPNGIACRSQTRTEVLLANANAEDTFNKGTEKFYAEAEMVAQFNGNPNIVGVYDYFRANNTVYLIMEYLNGITLKNYVKKHGKISDGQALFVMDKMAAALSITHSAGVLHRDISPDNIMVCLDGKIKLIDFGAARQIVAESSSNLTVVMKPGYTPIEQYTKKGKQGAWTDIYALGASIYYTMTGKIIDDPYERMENDSEFVKNIYGINDTLWNVIKKCTMINASDRYGSAIELRKALNATSAPLQAEPIVLEVDDVKIGTGEKQEVIVKTEEPDVTEPIELFPSEEVNEPEQHEQPDDKYELPDTPAKEGYNPYENVYDKTVTKNPRAKKPAGKKLIGILGAAAAVVVIAVGAVFLLPRLLRESSPVDAKVLIHLGFESADGLTAVNRTSDVGSNGGATFGINESDHEIIIAEGKGAVGNALYLDGSYGIKFDMVRIDDDSYTISFWYKAERINTFSPIIQMGRNMGKDPSVTTVSWINFTDIAVGDTYPTVWNRNSGLNYQDTEIWPWMQATDGRVYGLNEWCLVTVVADGKHYTCDDGSEHVGARLYINGELKRNCSDEVDNGLCAYIFAGDGIEGYIGINYWDNLYQGYIDEFYVFDDALTAEQVKTLYEAGSTADITPDAGNNKGGGNGSNSNSGNDGNSSGSVDHVSSAAPVDNSSICTLGTPNRVLEWWTENTDSFELDDGDTLTARFNLYSDAAEFWHTLVTAFVNVPINSTLIPNDDNYEGYFEYAILRADWWGWGDESYYSQWGCSWGEDDVESWLALTTNCKVELTITRNGGEVNMDYLFTGTDGKIMNEYVTFTSTMTADSPVFLFFTGEGAYIELLEVNR